MDTEILPFANGHMHRRNQCMTCGKPTRRTVRSPYAIVSSRQRYVLCSRCELPSPEARLLMAIFNVVTLPALEAKRLADLERKNQDA